jgi:hypothetical protein
MGRVARVISGVGRCRHAQRWNRPGSEWMARPEVATIDRQVRSRHGRSLYVTGRCSLKGIRVTGTCLTGSVGRSCLSQSKAWNGGLHRSVRATNTLRVRFFHVRSLNVTGVIMPEGIRLIGAGLTGSVGGRPLQ